MFYKKLEIIKNILIKNQLTLSVAESCTGGLISSYMTDVEGASDFIEQNFVTYSESAKHNLLKVKLSTLKKYTVYSKQTAKEMCEGLLKYSDIGLSTTGILGPAGGTKQTPVGTVFIGVCNIKKTDVVEYHSKLKTRIEIKKDITEYAITVLEKFLTQNYK